MLLRSVILGQWLPGPKLERRDGIRAGAGPGFHFSESKLDRLNQCRAG